VDPGIVAIGRNEGDRLRRCLASLVRELRDDRVRRLGLERRQRGAGALGRRPRRGARSVGPVHRGARAQRRFERLLEEAPATELVQFVDADCALSPGWLETATRALRENPDVAVVCGRRRERFPETSVYNRLCDVEWDTPVGEARACGGGRARAHRGLPRRSAATTRA
jgi:hypothetical protein